MRLLGSILRKGAAIILWTCVISVLWVFLLRYVDPPVTWVMVEQAHEQGGVECEPVSLDRMARSLPLAVIASEDQRFFHHHGFEWGRIRKAMDHNEKNGGRIRGASTITQQMVKNVFLWPGRTWTRKGLEAWFTILVELLWSKERILEVYLNVAEMGKGVFGAEAAAQHCFGKEALRLTPGQSALITATLPRPRKYACRQPTGYLAGRQQWVLRQMHNIGDQMDPEVRRRIGEKITRERKNMRSGE